jgi:hypothetical protein
MGVAFNWTPDRILYIAEPGGNSIASLPLSDDGAIFKSGTVRHLSAPELATPVDVTAAVPEIINPDFSSNSTMAGGSDLFVANRGNGTLVRMKQDGKVIAVRQIQLPGMGDLGADRLEGLAISPDATRLWVTVSGTVPGFGDAAGAVLEVPAFGAAGGQ